MTSCSHGAWRRASGGRTAPRQGRGPEEKVLLVWLGENSTERLGMDGDAAEKLMAGVAGLDVGVGVGKEQSGAGDEQEKQEGK